MGLLDNYTGVGMSPRPEWRHQNAIFRLIGRSYNEITRQGLVIYPEATVTDDWNDKAPDLVIFDKASCPLSIIEITTTAQLYAIIDKCEELMQRFPLSEYFVYDNENEVLYMYDIESNQWLSSKEYELYSKYLNNPLRTYLENTP
jgi:Uma2 family endonuclease